MICNPHNRLAQLHSWIQRQLLQVSGIQPKNGCTFFTLITQVFWWYSTQETPHVTHGVRAMDGMEVVSVAEETP